jgi:hypothetical protein
MTQAIILLAVIVALFVGLDLNRRAQAGKLVGGDADILQAELDRELEHQVELEANLDYVLSDESVAKYVREEGGMLLPGEIRIVPFFQEMGSAPQEAPAAAPTPDPALNARPWQVWWQLVTDAPMPSR